MHTEHKNIYSEILLLVSRKKISGREVKKKKLRFFILLKSYYKIICEMYLYLNIPFSYDTSDIFLCLSS